MSAGTPSVDSREDPASTRWTRFAANPLQRIFVWTIGIVAGVTLLMALLQRGVGDDAAAGPPPESVVAKSVDEAVAIRAFAESGIARPGETVRAWLTIRNGSKAPLAPVAVQFPPLAEAVPISGPFAPGTTRTLRIERTAPSRGVLATAVLVTWSGGREQVGLVLPAVRVATATSGWLASLTRAVKDFSLPLVVLLLPLVLDAYRRSEEKARQERERLDAERREGERREAERRERLAAEARETWRQMLPVSHEYAATYYMPLYSAVSALRFTLRATDAGAVDDELLYGLTLARRLGARLVDEKGGYYFKNRAGERLAVASWDLFLDEIDAVLGDAHVLLHDARDRLSPTESLPTFLSRRAGSLKGLFDALAEALKAWTPEVRTRHVALLGVFAEVLLFEANRVYENWYGEPEAPPFEALRAAEQELFGRGTGGSDEEYRALLGRADVPANRMKTLLERRERLRDALESYVPRGAAPRPRVTS